MVLSIMIAQRIGGPPSRCDPGPRPLERGIGERTWRDGSHPCRFQGGPSFDSHVGWVDVTGDSVSVRSNQLCLSDQHGQLSTTVVAMLNTSGWRDAQSGSDPSALLRRSRHFDRPCHVGGRRRIGINGDQSRAVRGARGWTQAPADDAAHEAVRVRPQGATIGLHPAGGVEDHDDRCGSTYRRTRRGWLHHPS